MTPNCSNGVAGFWSTVETESVMAGLSSDAARRARERACRASGAQAGGGSDDGLGRGGARQAIEQQLALLDRVAHRRIDRHLADEFELDRHFEARADEAVDD